MALDGIAIASLVHELKENLVGGRVDKIYQPESDEIVMAVRSKGSMQKLLLTANSSHPRLHITEIPKENPQSPPVFCMVLRKHLTNGKIMDITQPNFERIVNIYVEALNEMGDIATKKLVIEIMGKHSNIILVDENEKILDSVKHISHEKSSVREVLPGKQYALPPSQGKQNPLEVACESFMEMISAHGEEKIQNVIYQNLTGISPLMAEEMCVRAEINPIDICRNISADHMNKLYDEFNKIVERIKGNQYEPEIIRNKDTNKVVEFAPLSLTVFHEQVKEYFESMSKLLEYYFGEKDKTYRTQQKTQDLRKLIQQNIERCLKKKDMQNQTLREIANRERDKIKGELLTANIYSIKKGMEQFTTQNFYDENNGEMTIELNPNLTPSENAQKYFKKYNKAKRTFIALQEQIAQNDNELEYLESILTSVQSVENEQDIAEIREELSEQGITKKRRLQKDKKQKKSKFLQYESVDGYIIYVGKNNKQNDEITLKIATTSDIWLHTKEIPGSHVIIKAEGREVPNTTIEEAVNLAAFYSKARNGSLVPVDYTQKRNVKKPSGAKPGMVIYENNKTAYITPNEEKIKAMKQK